MQITILLLALAIVIAGVLLILYQTSGKKSKNTRANIQDAKDKVTVAKQELDQVLKEAVQ